MTEIDHENISIYVETLFALARDAWRQDQWQAFNFIKEGYLTALVPGNALDAFIAGLPLKPDLLPPPKWLKPDDSGGSLVTNPVPPPRLPPTPSFVPRESATLKW